MMLPLQVATAPGYPSRFEGYRAIRENVWRRHQFEGNKSLSGWKSEDDKRRRLTRFCDRYSVQSGLRLESCYVYLHWRLPSEEIEAGQDILNEMFHAGKWKISRRVWQNGSLRGKFQVYKNHPYDVARGEYIDSYRSLDLYVWGGFDLKQTERRSWQVFSQGVREQGRRGCPSYVGIDKLEGCLPAQIELGCGPSIDAGIPPLNVLHSIYSLWDKGKFCFSIDIPFVRDILVCPTDKYHEITAITRQSFLAPPTPFYEVLLSGMDCGKFLGPVFTNNFDGICHSMGIREEYLRRFDRQGRYPDYRFKRGIKSLLVVGSHADRRYVQMAARKRKIPIVFVDPEGYADGTPYLIEGAQDEDLIIPLTSSDFAEILRVKEFCSHPN